MSHSEDGGWRNDRGYIWALVGSVIGFANLLGFGSQCYRHGGGAFLIPFVVALVVLGIPMMILEGVVGQRTDLPIVAAYGRFGGGRAKFWGWLAVAAVITIEAFYTALIDAFSSTLNPVRWGWVVVAVSAAFVLSSRKIQQQLGEASWQTMPTSS